jgi:DNA-binding transcriptional MerR regulator
MRHDAPDTTTPDLLTAADSGRIADLTPAAIRLAARSGRLPVAARTAGGIRLFARADVERFAANRKGRSPMSNPPIEEHR